MEWYILLQQMINGLALGSIYSLIALGYTMVYGIIKLINFAHGDIYMLGAYFGFYALTKGGLSLGPALLLSMGLAALVGVVLERIAYRPLRSSPRITALITAIGASLFIQSVSQIGFGASFKPFPQAIPFQRIAIGSVFITNRQLIMFGVSIFLMVTLHLIVQYTRIGKAMRAVSMDKEAAMLMGINVDRVISVTFALGSALAAAEAFWWACTTTGSILHGCDARNQRVHRAVLGGIGVIPGAVIGGFMMGMRRISLWPWALLPLGMLWLLPS